MKNNVEDNINKTISTLDNSLNNLSCNYSKIYNLKQAKNYLIENNILPSDKIFKIDKFKLNKKFKSIQNLLSNNSNFLKKLSFDKSNSNDLITKNSYLYSVEKILAKRINYNKIYYLIKWLDYSVEGCSWEPKKNLNNAQILINNFEKKLLNLTNKKRRENKSNFVNKNIDNKYNNNNNSNNKQTTKYYENNNLITNYHILNKHSNIIENNNNNSFENKLLKTNIIESNVNNNLYKNINNNNNINYIKSNYSYNKITLNSDTNDYQSINSFENLSINNLVFRENNNNNNDNLINNKLNTEFNINTINKENYLENNKLNYINYKDTIKKNILYIKDLSSQFKLNNKINCSNTNNKIIEDKKIIVNNNDNDSFTFKDKESFSSKTSLNNICNSKIDDSKKKFITNSLDSTNFQAYNTKENSI